MPLSIDTRFRPTLGSTEIGFQSAMNCSWSVSNWSTAFMEKSLGTYGTWSGGWYPIKCLNMISGIIPSFRERKPIEPSLGLLATHTSYNLLFKEMVINCNRVVCGFPKMMMIIRSLILSLITSRIYFNIMK